MKPVVQEKSPGLDGLPYKLYLTQTHVFVSLFEVICNNGMKMRSIPQRFTSGVMKLLGKDTYGGDGISNFETLTEIEILAVILASGLLDVISV